MSQNPDQWLNREEQAEQLGVSVGTIAQYVQRYRPDSPNPAYASNPYPSHVPGQHKTFGKSVAVLASALNTWSERRTGKTGRPSKSR